MNRKLEVGDGEAKKAVMSRFFIRLKLVRLLGKNFANPF